MKTVAAGSHRHEVADVLQLVVQHCPSFSSSCRDVCNLLVLNQACRTAVKQSVGHMNVSGDNPIWCDASRLAAFTAWYATHASLVSEMSLVQDDDSVPFAAAMQLVVFALQAAATGSIKQAGAASHVPQSQPVQPVQPVQPQQRPQAAALQLRSFKGICDAVSPALLEALSAATGLTSLTLPLDGASVTPRRCQAVSSLTGLRDLHLTSHQHPIPDCGLEAIGRLSQLTCLDVELVDLAPQQCRLLPPTLQKLELIHTAGGRDAYTTAPQLTHLTRLQDLLLCGAGLPPATPLPPALTALINHGRRTEHLGVGADRLQMLLFAGCWASSQLWQQLRSLTSLKTLVVTDLAICSDQALQHHLPCLAATTQVQSLSLHGGPDWYEYDSLYDGMTRHLHLSENVCPLYGLLLHTHMCKLRLLTELTIDNLGVQPGDAIHLTCLTALTALNLVRCPSLGDGATAFLISNLTGLKGLMLVRCGLQSPVVWRALAHLPGLQGLTVLQQAPRLDGDSLQLLAPLTNLCSFEVDAGALVASTAVQRGFLRGMPRLSAIKVYTPLYCV